MTSFSTLDLSSVFPTYGVFRKSKPIFRTRSPIGRERSLENLSSLFLMMALSMDEITGSAAKVEATKERVTSNKRAILCIINFGFSILDFRLRHISTFSHFQIFYLCLFFNSVARSEIESPLYESS